MFSQPPEKSQTAAITLSQLAAITGRDPSYFSLHKDELPEPVPVHVGTHGRPQNAYSIEQLAELVIQRTGHLSDSIVRLRLALSGHRPPVERDRNAMLNLKNLSLFSLYEVGDELVVLPNDLSELSPSLQTTVRAALAREHADTRARRTARRQLRTRSVNTEGVEP
ncbi:hypothetical protein HU718_021410 [Pseudomonas tensinigenes]|uniref:MerR family transcriptional regulator n=1 Tax=Pseudomonas tensinigenes TaxID=2745511 RepID=A0ABX8PU03_9PSED|nr:hypothetical protein [Pseudomonas tensinigenes]QXI04579.1 hypothetical protein HU718_021410 [Pseudomonas tensinigenes]